MIFDSTSIHNIYIYMYIYIYVITTLVVFDGNHIEYHVERFNIYIQNHERMAFMVFICVGHQRKKTPH